MSLNTVTFSPSRTPTPLQDEMYLRNVDNIEYALNLPESPSKKLEGRGKIFLTDLRLILVADAPTDTFESLSVPHTSLLSVKQETSRMFGSPRIQIEVKPTPGGGLGEITARAELRCNKAEKDAFLNFGAALEKTRERAVNKSRANPEEEFDLPVYGAGPSSSSTTYIVADVPSDAPPGYEP